MIQPSSLCRKLLAATIILGTTRHLSEAEAFSVSYSSEDAFSLPAYQKARALETSNSLDATRLHFQILFVDDDNAKGRIAEGLVAKVAEYNDAMCVVFPASATIANAYSAPRDAAAPPQALQVCQSLGLCPYRTEEIGTAFDLHYLDEYDLIIAMDDDIRSLILRSVEQENCEYYSSKCRSLAEFLSLDFCGSINSSQQRSDMPLLLGMLDEDQAERVAPFVEMLFPKQDRPTMDQDQVLKRAQLPNEKTPAAPRLVLNDQGAAVPNTASWAAAEAALILAAAGVTRFCLDTIDKQLNMAFQTLLDRNVCKKEHLQLSWDKVEDQLQRCNASVCGYFSPQQRQAKFDRHCADLEKRLAP